MDDYECPHLNTRISEVLNFPPEEYCTDCGLFLGYVLLDDPVPDTLD